MKQHRTIRWLAVNALSLGLTSLPAQTNEGTIGAAVPGQTGVTATEGQDQLIKMSAFEVTTTQGHGYVATNADAGFKTVQALIDIPQDIQVVTRDMIDDIGSTISGVTLKYFGAGGTQAVDEAVKMRGYANAYVYVDDSPNNESYDDSFYVDSYVVVRGDAQVLYVNAAPTGVALRYTKKPLPFQQTLITASIGNFGGTRVMLDTTGPIGSGGKVQFGYRVVAVQQGPQDYFYNVHESHEGLFGALQATINNTTVRFYSLYTMLMVINNGSAVTFPNGRLYVGGGPRDINVPPNDMEKKGAHRYTFSVDTKASDFCDFRFIASYSHDIEGGNPVALNLNYNYAAQTVSYYCRVEDTTIDYWTMLGDAVGKYHIAGLSQQDNLGFGFVNALTHQYFPQSSAFPSGSVTVPLYSQAAVDAVRLPSRSQFPAVGSNPAYNRVHTQTQYTSIYYQHTFDVIPGYLTGVVGWTFATIGTENVLNVSVIPYQASVIPVSQWLHRFGLVAHPVKDIAVYALDAIGLSPPAGAAPILLNGQLAPNQAYQNTEVGFKTSIWNGRISSTFAVFRIAETNLLVASSTISPITGTGYYIPIGSGTGEGWDGNVELALTPNWQFIVYGYHGAWKDVNGLPLPTSYDKSWSVFTRYAFPAASALQGLAIGAGAVNITGEHDGIGGVVGASFAAVPTGSTQTIETQGTFEGQAFVNYWISKHLEGKLSCTNITDHHYAAGYAGNLSLTWPSLPRTFVLELDYKF